MDNSLLAVRDINHKYIVVERRYFFMYQRMKMLLGGLILSTGLVVSTPVSYAAERYRLKTILKNYKKYAGKKPIHRIKF